jgi:hypothetical protein
MLSPLGLGSSQFFISLNICEAVEAKFAFAWDVSHEGCESFVADGASCGFLLV